MLLVLSKILVVLLLVGAGVFVRRRGWVDEPGTAMLSRLVVDLAFPALVIAELVRSVGQSGGTAIIPLLGAGILLVGALVGFGTSWLFAGPKDRRTYVFLASLPNWIFLPLLIVEALHGAAGVRVVLLINVGALVVLLTFGVWILQGGSSRQVALELLRNPGLLATVGGILIATGWPAGQAVLAADPTTLSTGTFVVHALLTGLSLLGSLTVPLSVLVIGTQLGGLGRADLLPERALVGVLVSRLLLVPLLLLAGGLVSRRLFSFPQPGSVPWSVVFVISAMPVAVSSSLFVQRFGGTIALAAKSVLYSTVLSVATTPTLFWLHETLR